MLEPYNSQERAEDRALYLERCDRMSIRTLPGMLGKIARVAEWDTQSQSEEPPC